MYLNFANVEVDAKSLKIGEGRINHIMKHRDEIKKLMEDHKMLEDCLFTDHCYTMKRKPEDGVNEGRQRKKSMWLEDFHMEM